MQLYEVYAKSNNYGSLTLLEHTAHVVKAIAVFAQNYNLDPGLAIKGAILHDIGKAHPHFQRKIRNINGSSDSNREWNYIHRHEISSLAFLPCFSSSEWNILIDMVVAHHKAIENDAAAKGVLDLAEHDRNFIINHLQGWNDWPQAGYALMNAFNLPVRTVTYEEAFKAIEYVVDYCEKKGTGWSPWRGLLMSADHFASAFMHTTEDKLTPLFKIPDYSFYSSESRKSELYPLSAVPSDDSRTHTLVVAPTGAGKTDFLIRRCKGRLFYTLPFQASINAMWDRLRTDLSKDNPSLDIRMLHSTSRIIIKDNIDEQLLQPLAGSSVKVLTPHQLAAIIFGTSGFESIMLDIQGTDVILDEIHTYSDYSRAMVVEIVKALLKLDCRIHIGTATMPAVLYNGLLNILGGTDKVYQVRLPDNLLDTFNRHRVFKIEGGNQIKSILNQAFSERNKVLIVYNTIAKAQKAYEQFRSDYPRIPMMLIHSRFRHQDRYGLEKRLKCEFNEFQSQPCLVVSTQVVEVSLDISFDTMITECAPLDSLIQRFGRINRKRNNSGLFRPVYVIKPEGNVLPYRLEILNRSFEELPDNGEILEERTIQNKIDNVYPALDLKEIDLHLICRNENFLLKELTNSMRAVLVDALEIESATCILESDREAYLTAQWEDRVRMEIPINYKSIIRHQSHFEQLNVGSNPFVIPQERDVYMEYGLKLIESNNII